MLAVGPDGDRCLWKGQQLDWEAEVSRKWRNRNSGFQSYYNIVCSVLKLEQALKKSQCRWKGSFFQLPEPDEMVPKQQRYHLCWPSFTVRTVLHRDRLAPVLRRCTQTSQRINHKGPQPWTQLPPSTPLPRHLCGSLCTGGWRAAQHPWFTLWCVQSDVMCPTVVMHLNASEEFPGGESWFAFREFRKAVCLFVQGLSRESWLGRTWGGEKEVEKQQETLIIQGIFWGLNRWNCISNKLKVNFSVILKVADRMLYIARLSCKKSINALGENK